MLPYAETRSHAVPSHSGSPEEIIFAMAGIILKASSFPPACASECATCAQIHMTIGSLSFSWKWPMAALKRSPTCQVANSCYFALLFLKFFYLAEFGGKKRKLLVHQLKIMSQPYHSTVRYDRMKRGHALFSCSWRTDE